MDGDVAYRHDWLGRMREERERRAALTHGTETPRDLAYRLLASDAWDEDRTQIYRDCGILAADDDGAVEAINRAFMAGVELAVTQPLPGYVVVVREDWERLKQRTERQDEQQRSSELWRK